MPDDDLTDLTEMTAMDATRVDAVKGAANGATFLLVKALAEDADLQADLVKATTAGVTADTGVDGNPLTTDKKDCPTCAGKGSIRGGNVKCPDCKGDGQVAKGLAVVAKAGDDADLAPGSPDWEAQDSALLHDAATALATVAGKLDEAQDREEAEVMAGESDDLSDVVDLDDAMACLQQALGIVSRLVYTEGAEADDSTTDGMAMAKADGMAMAKAGKRLSATSEQSLKEAIAVLTALLAGDGATTAEPPAADDTAGSTPAPKGEPVAKGAAGTDNEEELDMDQAELTKMLDERDAKLTTGITDMIKGLLPAAALAAEPPPVAVVTPAPQADLVKGLAEAFKEAVAPLEDRLAKMEARPQRGAGPLTTTPRGGAPGGDVAAMVKGLLAEADATHNPGEAARLRQQASLHSLSVGYQTGRVYDTVA